MNIYNISTIVILYCSWYRNCKRFIHWYNWPWRAL